MIRFLRQLFIKRGTCSRFMGRARTTDSNPVYTSTILAVNPGEAGTTKAQTQNSIINDTVLAGLTAHAGGGQGSAVLLKSGMNEVTVCATIGDSTILPASVAGADIYVANKGAASMNVFPATGEQINKAGANTAFAVAAGKNVIFFCVAVGNWYAILSA